MTAAPAPSGRWLTPTNPINGEQAGVVPISEPAEVPGIVAAARAAFAGWADLGHSGRRPYLRAFARHALNSTERIATVIRSETGKDLGDAHAEVVAALTVIDYYTRHAAGLLRPKKGSSWPFLITKGWTEYHPIGVAAIITPWNYPFYLPILGVIEALAAGCTVVLKPSEVTPLSGDLIRDLALEAGIPEGVVTVVHGYGDTGAALVSADTDIVSFTGSPRVGRAIATAAAAQLKPVILELGGKDAQIVLEDANLRAAARAAVNFGVFNAGHTCVGVERVYVVSSVYDEFMTEMRTAIGRVAAATGDRRDIGPLISPPQVDIIERHLTDAVGKGAVVVAGGNRIETEHGIYFEPTLVTDVDHSMELMQQETFGPIVPVMRVADAERALAMANDSVYGLHGSVWTKNHRRGREIASRMRTGTVAINDHLINFLYPSIPLGGIGESGYGDQLGEDGIKNFCVVHSITSARFGPTTRLLGAWLPRRVGPRYWRGLARTLFGWRR
jgi:acyl-CoA reductase-like NAD-dependent aldehyde dehydrogenase